MKKGEMRVAGAAVLFVFMILALMYLKTPLGFDVNIDTNYIQLFPGLFVVFIGLGVVVGTKGLFGLPGMFGVGMGFVYLCNEMYSMGMITTLMLTGLTIAQFNMWILVIFTVCGAILSALSYTSR